MIHVLAVQYVGAYQLALEFDDDSSGIADLAETVQRAQVFAPLRDPAQFARVFVDEGTACWPGDLDIAAERLYALVHGLPLPDTLEQARANESEVRTRSPGERGSRHP